MARRYQLRSILVALLLGPALLAGAADGCDCGDGPNLPETNAVGDCTDLGGSDADDVNPRRLTSNKGKIADEMGATVPQVRRAIHQLKRKANMERNDDLAVDIDTGEAYVKTPRGVGDSVGNLRDFLP